MIRRTGSPCNSGWLYVSVELWGWIPVGLRLSCPLHVRVVMDSTALSVDQILLKFLSGPNHNKLCYDLGTGGGRVQTSAITRSVKQ